jgi:GAF domain-containing protein
MRPPSNKSGDRFMSSNFTNFFQDDEDTNPSFLRITRTLLIIIIVGSILLLPLPAGIFGKANLEATAFFPLIITIIFGSVALYLVNQGKPGMAKLIIPLAISSSIVITAASDNGLRDTSMLMLPSVLIISALLLGKRAMWVAAPLTLVAVLIISFADLTNDKPVDPVGLTQVVTVFITILLTILVMQILVSRLTESIHKARENEQSQLLKNRELIELQQSLEDRVSQRTAELEKTTKQYERRVSQFEAISQVTRVITAIQDMDTLLPYITQVISEHFNVYHTGIFLLDTKREFAVLRAANSDGGRRMLMRGHKLRVGQTGIVGYVTATGQARIALDVDADVTYFNNPDMPETRSEIALPLRYAGQVIGALDAQSVEPNAFMQDDIEVLITLADQVAATINNAVTLEESRKELEKYQKTAEDSMREYWKVMRPKSLGLGLHLIESEIQPLEKPLEGEYIQDAIAQNKAIMHTPSGTSSVLAIPVRLRGKVIGVMTLKTKADYKLTSDDAEIVEAVIERLSLAMETASLLQATQHRANIERITTDVSSRISSSSRFETIMQTAAQEISRALGGSDVIVQIEPISIELGLSGS